MSKSFNSGMEEIRQESTQYAVFHINKTPELLEKYMEIKNMHKNKKFNSETCLGLALRWAEENKNTFGDLFQTELDLVRWNNVLELL